MVIFEIIIIIVGMFYMKLKTHILFSTAFLLSASIASAGLYRWVDDKGNVHFSDKVPAAASKKAHTKIDKSGISQRELDPEAKIKKQRELEKIALERAEEEKINKEIRKKRIKVRKRDRYLLSTYENKAELVKSFQSKIKMLKGNTAILLAHKKRLEKKLSALKSNKPERVLPVTKEAVVVAEISDPLSAFGLPPVFDSAQVKKVKKVKKEKIVSRGQKIINIEDTIKQYKKALLGNDRELLSLNGSFDVDLKRYLELTN